jgi:putative ABC transport system permease protein
MDLLRRIRYLLHRSEHSEELEEEMRLHMELRERQLRERGMASGDAHFAARREFGNRAEIEIASSAVWGWTWLESLAQDVRYAVRALRKTPGFVTIAVVTLAIGIGMNTAVFSIVNAVMLRSLPYPEPDRLVSIWEQIRPQAAEPNMKSSAVPLGSAGTRNRNSVAPANLMDYRSGTTAFEGLAAVDALAMNLTGIGTPERITGERVTANYFSVLGVAPELGRTFTEAEDGEGSDRVVVLAHSFWQRHLGGDQSVIGQTLTFDSRPFVVIGVMPPAFQPATQYVQTVPVEFFVPAQYSKELLHSHGDHEVAVIGRLKSGVDLQTARAQLDSVSEGLAQRFPDSNRGVATGSAPLRDDIIRDVGDGLRALLAASGLIVLITCINVANLLLVRAVGRRHETSVRLALGGGRGRIVRALLTESLLVAMMGCAAGVVLGRALMRLLVSVAPASIPRLDAVNLDWRVFALAAAIALITGLVFGLAPASQAWRARPAESLKGSERHGGSKVHARWRGILTVVEVALSLVLAVGAGLFLKSFTRIMGMDLGFQTDRVIAMNVNLPVKRYPNADQRFAFFDQLETHLRALPGVQAVAFANRLPMRGGWGTGIQMDNVSPNLPAPDSQAVNDGYFETLGIPLVRGRLLIPGDRKGQPYVAVVNLAFSRLYLNGGDPIGKRFRRGPTGMWFNIVGVVNDVRRRGKTGDVRPQIYLPAAQTDGYPVFLADLAVRTQGDPHRLLKAIQQEVWSLDKDQPITAVRTMDEIVSQSVAEQRFQMMLLTVFAGVAVTLAMIGVFGVLSHSVNQRMNEIGVRIALGASPANILGLVMKQAGGLVASGAILGLAGAWAVTRLVGHLLFHVEAHDAATYVGAVAALVLVALVAATIPARRGARVDPVVALRYE